MIKNEGPIVEYQEISVIETLVTFFIIPTAMFVVISLLAYVMSAPRKAKSGPSVITTIQ